MKLLIKIRGGSHLYGTATPQSDLDFVGAHIAGAREILLQTAKPVIVEKTSSSDVKNTAEDVDFESYEIQRWLKMLGDGETRAYELLFAPRDAMVMLDAPLWADALPVAMAQRNRRVKGFVGYCRRQAAKYGIKGSRVAAVRSVLGLLAGFQLEDRLALHEDRIAEWAHVVDHAKLSVPEGSTVPHLIVCDRACPLTNRVRHAVEIYARVEAEYGARARAAERSDGIDWKAMSHAVRVGTQTIELLSTGHITFPRPDRDELLRIKLGHLAYPVVAERLETLIDEIDALAPQSALPEEPDRALAEEFVVEVHRRTVNDG